MQCRENWPSATFLLVSERECLEARARFSAGPMSWGPCATGSTPMAWRSIASGEIVAIGSEDVYENWAPPTRRVGAREAAADFGWRRGRS